MDSTEFTCIEVCAGYGGIGLGIERVIPSLRVTTYVEIEQFAVANLAAKMEAGQLAPCPIWTNVKTFSQVAESFRGKVDILTAGFPCQPFSTAGKRAGTEDPRHLFPHIKRVIQIIRPRQVFLENVEGLLSTLTLDFAPNLKRKIVEYCEGIRQRMGSALADKLWSRCLKEHGRSALWYVCSELEQLGYRVEAGLFSASEVGAPHQRKRVFILAQSNSRSDGNRRPHGRLSGQGWERPKAGREGLQQKWETGSDRPEQAGGNNELGNTLSDGFSGGREEAAGTNGRSESGGMLKFERASGELGDPEHNGQPAKQELRSDETTGNQRGQKEQITPRQSKGADRPTDAGGVQRSEERGELADGDNRRGGEDRQSSKLRTSGTEQPPRNSRDGKSPQKSKVTFWPARPSEPQYDWEPPRVTTGQTKCAVDGNFDGTPDRLDYAELCISSDNRTDELRLLGNGCVPAQVAKAYEVLSERLKRAKT